MKKLFTFGKKKDEPLFVTNHMAAGGARGILTFGPLIFLETLTRLPLSKTFNMHSGSSAGAAIAGILNIPKSKGSEDPRYSALDGEAGYKKILQLSLPKRRGRMVWRLGGMVVREIHEMRKEFTRVASEKLDENLSIAVNFSVRKKKGFSGEPSPRVFRELHFFSNLNKNIFKSFDDMVERFIDWTIGKSRYDVKILHRAIDAAFRFEDTNEPVTLGDTGVSHHVTAINLTRNDPAFFFHSKDLEGETRHISDPGVSLSDITAASCAAPTVFDSHVIRYEDGQEHYADIGHHDGPVSALSSLQGHPEEGQKHKFVIIGTGKDVKEFSLRNLEGLLYLMWEAPQQYLEKRDMKMLRQQIGAENVVEVDLPISLKTFSIPYQGNKKLMRAASILGFDLAERDRIEPWKKLTPSNKFDTSPETVEKLSEAKWDMVWHNMDKLVPLARWLLVNAAAQGRITQEFAEKAVSDINWLYPPEGHESSEYPEPETPFINIRQAKPSIIIKDTSPAQQGMGKWLSSQFRRKSDAVEIKVQIGREGANDNAPDIISDAKPNPGRRKGESASPK